ncbi:hypothetical protein AB4Z51_43630 [Bradyrhizobium sp. 2TAF36]
MGARSPLIDPEYAIDPTDDTANGSSNDSTDRTRCPLAFARAALDASEHALS